jgi:hypothetical protein
MTPSSSLFTFAISLFITSLFFWGWALKNTIGMTEGMWDLGLFSFFTVALSSSYLMALTNRGLMPSSWLTKALVTCSIVLVALNYAVGAYIGFNVLEKQGFGIYCVIFTFLWAGTACFGSTLMGKSIYEDASAAEQSLLL